MTAFTTPILIAVGIYGLIVATMYGFQRQFLYLPDTRPPEIAQSAAEVIVLESEPGLQVSHLFRPPADPDGPILVVFHGNAGHAGHRLLKFQDVAAAGIGLFLAEYRGYGGNPGRPDEQGLTRDAQAVMAFLQDQGTAMERIVLYGESLGNGPAVKMARQYPVAGFIMEAPYTSVADLAQTHYWYLPAKWLVHDKWLISPHLAQIPTPVLVLHGNADRVIPVRFGKKIFAMAPEPKTALFHPTAGHNDMFSYAEVVSAVIDFTKSTTEK